MNEDKYFISEHMETIRKYMGWSQQDLATKLGLKQKTISNYLAKRHTIPATVWFDFCQLADLEPSLAHNSGLEISVIGPLELSRDISQVGNFKIPAEYRVYPGASIRTIQPVKAMMIKHFGAEFFKDFLKSKGLEVEYTNILNAPINSLLIAQMAELLIEKRVLTSPNELYPYLRKDQVVSKFVGKTKSTSSFLAKTVSLSHRADINHDYELLDANDKEVHLRFKNRPHLNELITNEETRLFFGQFVTGLFSELITLNGLQAHGMEVIEKDKDHAQCTLKVIL